MCKIFYQKKKISKNTFLILSFFLHLNFNWVKNDEFNEYIFITLTQHAIKNLI